MIISFDEYLADYDISPELQAIDVTTCLKDLDEDPWDNFADDWETHS